MKSLDIGLRHTETVNTSTEHFVRVVDCGSNFFAEYFFNLRVGAVGSNLSFKLLGCENFGKVILAGESLIIFHEKGDKIVLAVLRFLRSLLYCFHEVWFDGVVGKRFYNIGHRNFQNHVHTSFKVETETDLHFLTLLERVSAEPNLFILNRIKILGAGNLSHFFSLVCIVAGNEREGEVVDADER